MLKSFFRFAERIFVLAIFLGLVYIVYLAVRNTLTGFTFDTTVLAAFVAALTAVFGYLYTQSQTTSRNIAEAHRSKKVEIFETFMDVWSFFQQEDGKAKKFDVNNPNDPITKKLKAIQRGVLVWGSPNLISAWLKFRRMPTGLPAGDHSNLWIMDNVLKAFRRELGDSNFGLKRGDLVRILLKDPDELK